MNYVCMYELWELNYKESWVLKNWCFWTVVLEKTLESLLDCKDIQPVHPKGDQSWVFIGRTSQCWSWNCNTLATWCEEWTHLKRPWCWERLRAGGEGDDRGWDGWRASPTHQTWVWVTSRSWWWTGRPGMLRCMGLQRVGHDWVTELNLGSSSSLSISPPFLPNLARAVLWQAILDLRQKENYMPHVYLSKYALVFGITCKVNKNFPSLKKKMTVYKGW